MPSNKNAMMRYKLLDELLSNRFHNYSIPDMVDAVNNRLAEFGEGYSVGRRTIEKDIKYLEEGPFEAEIERYCVDGAGSDGRTIKKRCLRYVEGASRIFEQKMNADEELMLRGLLRIIGQFDGLPNFGSLEQLRQRVNASDDDRNIISFTRNPLAYSNILGELFTAISGKEVVEFRHYHFDKPDEKRLFRVNPLLLREYNCRWFLIGTIVGKGKMFTFALDRISDLRIANEIRYEPYDGSLEERFDDIIGVTDYKDRTPVDIVFWASDKALGYVLSKPLHDSQTKLSENKDAELRRQHPVLRDGRFFRIRCKYNYELIRELMSYKSELIVLSPKEIRDEIVQALDNMAERYKVL